MLRVVVVLSMSTTPTGMSSGCPSLISEVKKKTMTTGNITMQNRYIMLERRMPHSRAATFRVRLICSAAFIVRILCFLLSFFLLLSHDKRHARTQSVKSRYGACLYFKCLEVVLTVGFRCLPYGIASLVLNVVHLHLYLFVERR